MLQALEYIEINGEALLYRCYGEGSFLELPDRIDDLPVTGLADHIFAREPSWKLRDVPKRLAVRREKDGLWVTGSAGPEGTKPAAKADARTGEDARTGTDAVMGETALSGTALEEIALPPTLKRIGNYAFYGCHSLQVLSLPTELEELGSGAFVDCNHLKEVCFCSGAAADSPAAKEEDTGLLRAESMKTVIGEISYEVEAVVRDAAGKDILRLVFPEYYEDSIENTPARIFIMKYEGTGYKYRQCFSGVGPDLKRYDTLFQACVDQEFPDTVIRLAANRLLYPLQLEEAPAREMIRWMQENRELTARYCLKERREADGTALLRVLRERGFFTEDMLAFFLDKAGTYKNPEAVSLLMNDRGKVRKVSYAARFQL